MTRSRALGTAIALGALANACADPPPYANAGRLQNEPGDAASFALVSAETSVASNDGSPTDGQATGDALDEERSDATFDGANDADPGAHDR